MEQITENTLPEYKWENGKLYIWMNYVIPQLLGSGRWIQITH
jgi:hypothetical protein